MRLFSGAMQSNTSVANAYVADITRARGPRQALRPARRDVRPGLHPRPGDGRAARRASTCTCRSSSPARWRCCNCSTAGSCCPSRCRPSGAGRSTGARAQPDRVAARARRSSKGVGTLVAVVACTALAQFMLYTTWVLYTTFKFGWGPQQNGWSLFAVGVHVGAGPGLPARPAAEALLAAAAGVVGLVSSTLRLPRLGRGDRGLDDLRRDPLQRPRLHRRGVDPEHHLERRRRDDAGPHDGRGELAATA